MVKVAINGFGRIGRLALRKLMEQTDKFEVVAINDLTDAKTLAHLFKYDSAQGRFNGEIEVKEGAFVVNGQEIKVTAERNPENLPWARGRYSIRMYWILHFSREGWTSLTSWS